MNAYSKIRQSMRENEQRVLDYFRRNPTADTFLFSMPFRKALDRLEAAKKITYRRSTRTRPGAYIVRKYARPVTN
jgi:hypothetical protein